ncbi:Mitochondrial ATPase inhibitor [Arabidopsis suecica]|uniref:Mitochondrial ATPase inhibitor n=1 Tax=Arabidopsis suecica TaxID=45249 RepID=A0A8T1Z857_ARASU|nr:Mitochondrial ATPase inhibitor [Arabidopsis suecica]
MRLGKALSLLGCIAHWAIQQNNKSLLTDLRGCNVLAGSSRIDTGPEPEPGPKAVTESGAAPNLPNCLVHNHSKDIFYQKNQFREISLIRAEMSSARSAITNLRLARSMWETQIGASRSVESTRGSAIRCFSDDKGRVLSEEEHAKESMYIKKMEKEILEKKKKLEKHKPDNEKGSADKKPDASKP